MPERPAPHPFSVAFAVAAAPDYPSRMNASALSLAADAISAARALCVLSGAGMSAESGVATFRDAQGLWSQFNPADLATPQAFARDPLKVWAWYRWRRSELARRRPHDGHLVLAKWEHQLAARRASLTLITQNVDGLHHQAGSRNIIELHGRLDVARCTACPHRETGLHDLGEDPHCPVCGARMRPGVVWFNEPLTPGAFEAAQRAVRECDVALIIGTSGVVQPAASLADAAKAAGARLIEINPEPTPISEFADVCIRERCGSALTALDAAMALSSPGA